RSTAGPASVAIALRLGARGVEAFHEIPELWCTAPTTERWGLGYCLNAPFALDVGRGQLARTAPENTVLFRALGEVLARAFGALAAALETRFGETLATLGIEIGARTPDEVRREFWRSVFERLTHLPSLERGSDRTALLSAMHQGGAGLPSLVAHHPVLP